MRLKKGFLFTLLFLSVLSAFAQEPKLVLPIGHRDRIISTVVSPDGKKILTTSFDKTAKLWDLYTGKLLADLTGHKTWVFSGNFSPDGKKIITYSSDIIKIWDARLGKKVIEFNQENLSEKIICLDLDRLKLLTSGEDFAYIRDIESGKVQVDLKGLKGDIKFAKFSPDCKKVVTVSEKGVAQIWDVNSGELYSSLDGNLSNVESIIFSPDSIKVLAHFTDKTATIWEIQSGKKLYHLYGIIWSITFSPNGQKIMTRYKDELVKIWDAQSGSLVTSLINQTSSIYSAIFSPDGKKS